MTAISTSEAEVEIDPSAICERRVITPAEVRAMRRAYYAAEGAISADEADAVFAINNACPEPPPEWRELFVESLTDYVVNQAHPAGYVTVENAAWLMARIAVDGVVQSQTELELLVHVLEQARWSPPSLSRYALDQVRHAVLSGTGPAVVADAGPCVVTAAHVQLLRRILYAFAGDANIAITRAEAEVLFDIADGADEEASDPAWADLFAKAVASSVMVESGYAAPSRDVVLRQQAWLEEEAEGAGSRGRMVSSSLAGVHGSWNEASEEEAELAKLERERDGMLTAEQVTQPEAEWLAARIGRDGQTRETEKALLAFLKTECPSIHPALQPLLQAA
jgi:hypothetical protein